MLLEVEDVGPKSLVVVDVTKLALPIRKHLNVIGALLVRLGFFFSRRISATSCISTNLLAQVLPDERFGRAFLLRFLLGPPKSYLERIQRFLIEVSAFFYLSPLFKPACTLVVVFLKLNYVVPLNSGLTHIHGIAQNFERPTNSTLIRKQLAVIASRIATQVRRSIIHGWLPLCCVVDLFSSITATPNHFEHSRPGQVF